MGIFRLILQILVYRVKHSCCPIYSTGYQQDMKSLQIQTNQRAGCKQCIDSVMHGLRSKSRSLVETVDGLIFTRPLFAIFEVVITAGYILIRPNSTIWSGYRSCRCLHVNLFLVPWDSSAIRRLLRAVSSRCFQYWHRKTGVLLRYFGGVHLVCCPGMYMYGFETMTLTKFNKIAITENHL